MQIELPLCNVAKFAIVDNEDVERVLKYNWSQTLDGYVRAYYHGEKVLLHQFILWFPDSHIDHINGNKLDNRKINLRECSRSENARNQKKQSNCSSQYKGVTKVKNKWQAQIKLNGRKIYLGLFEDEIEAAKVYDRAAIIYFGEFAKLNFT